MRLGKPTPGRLHFAPPQQSSSHMTAAGISLRIRPPPWQFAAKGSGIERQISWCALRFALLSCTPQDSKELP